MNPAGSAYLEFQRKNGKTPMKYPLEVGSTTIGTSLIYDIRIKSKKTEDFSCFVNVNDNGVAMLENKSKEPILYNGRKMRNVQILKNNDEFEICGKRFRYINPKAAVAKISNAVKTTKRQSLTPNFKMKSASRIPVPAKTTNTRLSLSVTKNSKRDATRRSCASALPVRNRGLIYDWKNKNTRNVIAGPSFAAKKRDNNNLANLVRKSLFLKQSRGDISFSNSITFENNKRNSLIFNVDGSISRRSFSVREEQAEEKKTPLPRGVKRTHESSAGSATLRLNKRRKQNEKFSFNVSVSGTNELFENSESSDTSGEQNLTNLDFSLESVTQKSARRTPISQSFSGTSRVGSSFLDSSLDLLSPIKTRQITPKTDKSLRTPKSIGEVCDLTETVSSVNTTSSKLNSAKKTPKVQDLLNFGTPGNVFSSIKNTSNVKSARKFSQTPKSERAQDYDSVVGLASPIKLTPNTQKTAEVEKSTQIRKTSSASKTPKSRSLRKSSRSPKVILNKKTPTVKTGRNVSSLRKTPASAKVEDLILFESPIKLLSPIGSRKSTPKARKTSSVSKTYKSRSLRKSSRSPNDVSPEKKTPTVTIDRKISSSRNTPDSAEVQDLLQFESPIELLSPTKSRKITPKGQQSSSVSKTSKSRSLRKRSNQSLEKKSPTVKTARKASKTPKVSSSRKAPRGMRNLLQFESPVQFNSSAELSTLNTKILNISPKKATSTVRSSRKSPKTPKLSSSRKTSTSGRAQDLLEFNNSLELATPENVKKSTPRRQKISEVASLFKTPKEMNTPANKSSNLEFVRKSTLKVQKSPNTPNDQNIFKTPKPQSTRKSSITPKRSKTGKQTLKVFNSSIESISPVKSRTSITSTPSITSTEGNKRTSSGKKRRISGTPASVAAKKSKLDRSPKNALTDVRGVKKLLKTPKVQKSPKNDLTDVRGVRKLLKTPVVPKSPKNDLTDVRGLKKLMKTPKVEKSPKNDLTDVRGVKNLLRTPKAAMSPKNDLTDVRGLKKLMKTPKFQKSPQNDLTDVSGVRKLLKTPKAQKSPKNDLTDVRGVKKLLSSPKLAKSPKNDLTDVKGLKKLMKTPKVQKSPKNDLTDVRGVRKLMSPKIPKSPKNDLMNISGVARLMESPQVQVTKRQKSFKSDLSTGDVTKTVPEIFENNNLPGTRGRGRKKKEQPIASTPATEVTNTPETRGGRTRRARANHEAMAVPPNLKKLTSQVVESGTKKRRNMRVKKEKVEEMKEETADEAALVEKKKKTRGRKRRSSGANEDDLPSKRNVRGRERNDEGEDEETTTTEEGVEEKKKKTRGRKKKMVDNNAVGVEEEVIVDVKKATRGRRRAAEVQDADDEKKTRGKKKIIQEEDEVTRNKNKIESFDTQETQSTRSTRRKKDYNSVSTNEENNTSGKKGRRGRPPKATNEVVPVISPRETRSRRKK